MSVASERMFTVLKETAIKLYVVSYLRRIHICTTLYPKVYDSDINLNDMPEDIRTIYYKINNFWLEKENNVKYSGKNSIEEKQFVEEMRKILNGVPLQSDFINRLIDSSSSTSDSFGHLYGFCQKFRELTDLFKERIVKPPEKVADEYLQLNRLEENIQKYVSITEQYNEKLKNTIDEKNLKLKMKENDIKKIQGDIDFVERVGQGEVFRIVKQSRKAIDEIYTNYLLECDEIDKEIKSTSEKLEELRKENRTLEIQMRRKEQLLESGLQENIQKYDKDMRQNDIKCDQYQKEIEMIKHKIDMISAKIDSMKEEYLNMVQKEGKKEEKIKAKMRKTVAVIIIQKAFKNYLKRREANRKKKKHIV